MEGISLKEKAGNFGTNPKIIVCIPAYNEENSIEMLVKEALKHANEVIVCDDGSSDDTSVTARKAGALVVNHSKNLGYGNTIRTLFERALKDGADIIVTMDSDGQHDPVQIPSLIEPIMKEGVDIVIGSRFIKAKDNIKVPRYRSFGIKTITRFTNQASYYKNLTDAQSGFRAYTSSAIQRMNLSEDGMRISIEILLKAGSKNLSIVEVPITVNYDVDSPSTHNYLSHGISILFGIIHFISLRHPLVFYGLPGIVLLLISGFFAYNALELFSTTRFISTNLILLSIASSAIGIILLTTGSILFTIAVALKSNTKSTLPFNVIQYISFQHPLLFYGLPGVALVVVSGVFAYNALDYFSSWRYVTTELTNRLFITIGTGIVGIILLTTGSMLYSISAILRGNIRAD
jgi:glycosyltransferase involved in cell wall biosynthesis